MPSFCVECPRCHVPQRLPPHLNGRWIECCKCGFGFGALTEDARPIIEMPPPLPLATMYFRRYRWIIAAILILLFLKLEGC